MIREVRKGEELNLGSLKKFLLNKKLISDYQSELKIQQFSNGFSNLTYLIEIESRELVIRLPPKGAIFGHDMSREFKVLLGLNKGFDNFFLFTSIQIFWMI